MSSSNNNVSGNGNGNLGRSHHPYECSSSDYDRAESWCRQTISSGHEMMFSLQSFHQEIGRASHRFGLSFEALHSLFRNAHVIHMKRNSHSLRSQTMRHVKSYLNGQSLLTLAKRCNYPPSMMARLIVENVASSSSSDVAVVPKSLVSSDGNSNHNNAPRGGGGGGTASNNTSKKFITEALRHPEKMLGCASTSLLPEYLFSEKNGPNNTNIREGGGGETVLLLDNFSGKPLYDGDAVLLANDNNHRRSTPLSRLCLEVREAIDSDPMYGPRQDRERHNVGIEYELLLEQTLRSMDVPFETEAELRVRGTARTPDILLSCPVGVRVRRRKESRSNYPLGSMPSPQKPRIVNNLEEDGDDDDDDYEWKIICWIDSKALFGDIETHTNSVLPQVETYVHRFGPGLVLYWFGHAPLSRLGDGRGDVVIVGGNVPELMMMPTGEFHGQGGQQRG